MATILPLAAELSHLKNQCNDSDGVVPAYLSAKLEKLCQEVATVTTCLNEALQDKNPKAIKEVQEASLQQTTKEARQVADAVASNMKIYNALK